MRQAFITFRSHPTEKYLDEQFLTMLTPMCDKSIKYVISYEKQNTIDSHFHIIIFFENIKFDITNLRSKFNTKSWKNWFLQIKDKHTVITPKFDEGALQLKVIEKTQEDYLKTLGYTCKENVYRSKGYDEVEITEAVKFYHIQSRKPEPIDSSWKILTTKTAHAHLEQFSKKEEIPFSDNLFLYQLAKHKISTVQLSTNQLSRVMTELQIAHEEYDCEYEENILKYEIEGTIGDHKMYQRAVGAIRDLMSKLQENGIDVPEEYNIYY